jgi:GTP cyclohydrolase IIa
LTIQIQITIIRIDGYGPWTLTLGSDREARLQMLQSTIYCDVQRLFSERECLVYSNRFDEYFAISNGLSVSDHVIIHNQLTGLYPNLKLSMTIGKGTTPFEANINAHKSRQTEEALTPAAPIFGQPILYSSNHSSPGYSFSKSSKTASNSAHMNGEFVQIMHIDVNDSRKISLDLTPYEITHLIVKVYYQLSAEFLKKGCMTFFIGGDNFMVVSNDTSKEDAKKIINKVGRAMGIKLNCGIGIGKTGRTAAKNATKALDIIRDLREKGKTQSVYEIQ